MAVALALATCVAWGASDYLAGRNGRALPPATIAFLSHCAGLLLLVAALLIAGERFEVRVVVPASIGGALTGLGVLALYRALALGPMTIVAPIAGAGVVVPVFAGVLAGEPLSWPQRIGIAAAVAGLALATRPAGSTAGSSLAAPALAFAAALALGGSLVAIDRAGDGPPLWTATIVHAGALIVLSSAVVLANAALRLASPVVPALIAIGSLGALGHAAFAAAAAESRVAIVAVLASLYPVVTVLAAHLLDRERVTGKQGAGALLTLAAIAAIAAA